MTALPPEKQRCFDQEKARCPSFPEENMRAAHEVKQCRHRHSGRLWKKSDATNENALSAPRGVNCDNSFQTIFPSINRLPIWNVNATSCTVTGIQHETGERADKSTNIQHPPKFQAHGRHCTYLLAYKFAAKKFPCFVVSIEDILS